MPDGRQGNDHSGFVVLALDTWSGRRFSERSIATESDWFSWLPFVGTAKGGDDEGVNDDRTTTLQLVQEIWPLDDTEAEELRDLRKHKIGQIPWTASLIAAGINQYPAWTLEFFDTHRVRVDLTGEVVAVSETAAQLREQLRFSATRLRDISHRTKTWLRPTPPRRNVDRRLDALLSRVEAFAAYHRNVAAIQQRHDKLQWFEKVSVVDDFEHEIGSEWDRSEGQRLRDMATESDAIASIYLDALGPLARHLERV